MDDKLTFSDCSCFGQLINQSIGLKPGHPLMYNQFMGFRATQGECISNDEGCYHSFYIFTGIVFFISFFMSSGRVGSLILQLRAIDVADKVQNLFTRELEGPVYILLCSCSCCY
jgi:hypothetical protein